jgi:hypothetical protein
MFLGRPAVAGQTWRHNGSRRLSQANDNKVDNHGYDLPNASTRTQTHGAARYKVARYLDRHPLNAVAPQKEISDSRQLTSSTC